MIAVANTSLSRIYVGDSELNHVRVGNDIIWPRSGRVKFEAQGNTPVIVGLASRSTVQDVLQYSADGTNWTDFNTGTTIELSTSGTSSVYVRGKQSGNQSTSDFTQFTTSGDGSLRLTGRVNALWSYDNTNAALRSNCGYGMFMNCNRLRNIPNLLFTAKQAGSSCYFRMFQGCSNLNRGPSTLSADTVGYQSYMCMFQDCTSLIDTPTLPASTLGNFCYRNMFAGCTSITSGPALSAETLMKSCYDRMFYGCSSLTDAPVLPAETLVESCYERMFSGCTSLAAIECHATDISATKCVDNWVSGVAASGTFKKATSMSDWTTGASGIPSDWSVVDV